MRNEDLKYANDARNAVENSSLPGAWLLLVVVAVLMCAGVWWASWAKIEQTAIGAGRVIPSKQVQRVESLESGIVIEILVSEGDQVEAGESLIRIDDTGVSSRLGELRQRQTALTAELYRLQTQASPGSTFEMPADVDGDTKPFYLDQEAVFIAEQLHLEEKIAILGNQLVQRRQSLAEAQATSAKQTVALELAERELELTKKLFKKKAVTELEYLRIQRLVGELRGDREIMNAAIVRIAAEVSEAERLVGAETIAVVAIARERISRVKADMSIVIESLRAAQDKVTRAVFRSPVSGIINKINVATIGEVVQAGATLVEIVPLDDQLLIETKIRPQDIAFIRPGLKATVRLSAYDYTKYGTLSGVVERIGADTITDENQETFYQVIVATDEFQEIPSQIKIIPGMIATVDVQTGERTVLEYLLKPVLKIRDRALREPN